MQKRVFGHMRTAKAQISLCIRTVWSGPSLTANKMIGYYRTYERRAKARHDTLCMRRVNLILCILRMFENTFSHGATYIMEYYTKNKSYYLL